tara:strand:+ start:605 stop:898 length:294 start_codon:yes stop_codon:yes gene_type:complete
MIKRIASIVVGGILGYIGGIVVLILVRVVLVLAADLSVPMVVAGVILFGGIIAGGVLGNWTYDRYWNDWYKDRRKDTVPEHWNEPRRSNDMGNEPDD